MSYSLEQLLEWMSVKSRLFGWGAIVALDRGQLNRLLAQEYIKRFNTGSYLAPITGVIDSTGSRFRLENFLLDVPRLSFENAELNNSKARLRMDVIGGGQIGMRKAGADWMPVKVDWIGPLLGPRLLLDLTLADVPGNVGEGGLIYLDLSQSDNFTLDFTRIQHEQSLGGAFFKEQFRNLPDDKRIYPLGNIREGADPLLSAQGFKLRTQAKSEAARDSASADYGDGAVLGLIRMRGAFDGSSPETGADFRYLLPDDAGKNYSATVLTDLPRMALSQVCNTVSELLGNARFDLVSVAADEFIAATAKGGTMTVPAVDAINYHVPVVLPNPGAPEFTAIGHYSVKALELKAADRLTVKMSGDELTMTWNIEETAEATVESFVMLNEEGEAFGGSSEGFDTLYVGVSLSVVAHYQLDRENGLVQFKDISFEDTGSTLSPQVCWNEQSEVDSTIPDRWWEVPWDELSNYPGLYLFLLGVVFPVYVVAVMKAQISKGPDISPIIKKHLTRDFMVDGVLDEFIRQSIHLNFGHVIAGDEIHLKEDAGFFGRVNPASTHFAIDPLEQLVAAGTHQQFSTLPVVAGVEWKVEVLQTGLRTSSNPGFIDEQGRYSAPGAIDIEGGMTRVRVTATDPVNQFESSALVTVVTDTLCVRPLIEITTPGETVHLTAGNLGAADDLQWSILNHPGSGELSEGSGADNTYTAPTFPPGPPKPPAYTIDQVQVRDQNGEDRTSVIVTENALSINVSIQDLDVQEGRVELQASINGVVTEDAVWSILLDGPGSISEDGVYLGDPAAPERFVLIESKEDGGKYGDWTGLIVLPLPLTDYCETYKALSRMA